MRMIASNGHHEPKFFMVAPQKGHTDRVNLPRFVTMRGTMDLPQRGQAIRSSRNGAFALIRADVRFLTRATFLPLLPECAVRAPATYASASPLEHTRFDGPAPAESSPTPHSPREMASPRVCGPGRAS